MLTCEDLPRLIVVADYGYCGEKETWLRILHQIAEFSQDKRLGVQVRIQTNEEFEYVSLAQEALDILGPNCRTILNGSPLQADNLGYWGAHLPQRHIKTLERLSTKLSFLSAAVHNRSELIHAQRLPVTAVVCSPVFDPSWKATAGFGLEGLRTLCDSSSVPVFALGGITPTNCSSCMDKGAHGVATLSGVLGSSSPRSAIKKFLSAFT